jgi:hypothetical protein
MGDDLASDNVNRSYSLAATSIAIFTFLLIFLYPRYVNGEANAVLFQLALVVIGLATFAFVFAGLHFYASSLSGRMDDVVRVRYSRRGDRLWLLGYSLLLLAPSVVLASVRLFAVGGAWFVLWLGFVLFVAGYFPRVQTRP